MATTVAGKSGLTFSNKETHLGFHSFYFSYSLLLFSPHFTGDWNFVAGHVYGILLFMSCKKEFVRTRKKGTKGIITPYKTQVNEIENKAKEKVGTKRMKIPLVLANNIKG